MWIVKLSTMSTYKTIKGLTRDTWWEIHSSPTALSCITPKTTKAIKMKNVIVYDAITTNWNNKIRIVNSYEKCMTSTDNFTYFNTFLELSEFEYHLCITFQFNPSIFQSKTSISLNSSKRFVDLVFILLD